MEQEKVNNSDTSTTAESGGSASGRSYDCSFCKRGFTNAQALGGHMNIHRKDKAKAKTKDRVDQDPLIQSSDANQYFYPHIAVASYHRFVGERHVRCEAYMPPPDHGLQTGNNYEHCFFPVWRPDNLQGRVEGNLTMIRSTGDEDGDEEEVDLELRLGRLL